MSKGPSAPKSVLNPNGNHMMQTGGDKDPRAGGAYKDESLSVTPQVFKTKHGRHSQYGPAFGALITLGINKEAREQAANRTKQLGDVSVIRTRPARRTLSPFSGSRDELVLNNTGRHERRRQLVTDTAIAALGITALVGGLQFMNNDSSKSSVSAPLATESFQPQSPVEEGGISLDGAVKTSEFKSGSVTCTDIMSVTVTKQDKSSALRAMERVTDEPFTQLPSQQAEKLWSDVQEKLNSNDVTMKVGETFVAPTNCVNF